MEFPRRVYSFPPMLYYDDMAEFDWRIPGSLHRPTFSSVAQGMKFIRGASMQSPPSTDEETKMIRSIPSVLDFPNRKALARQGFYGNEYAAKEIREQADFKSTKKAMSADEKRKKFHHSGKSRSNWSLTDESEDSNSTGRLDTTTSMDSWSRGLVLKSFSDRFSSESSVESTDSFSEERRQLKKQNSISELRKQYEETIMKSMDGEYPVFLENDESFDSSENGGKMSLSDKRKMQVERLMSNYDDDGDYTAQARMPPLRELDPRSALVLAQNSTQSTLVGSPVTPNEMNFSFEKGLNDGEGEFNFTSPERHGKLSEQNIPSVSIIVEEENSPQESTKTGEVNQKQNSNELTSLTLCFRSDSCNTLVPQDSNIDSEIVDDLIPRVGDALSESASSSATLSTVIHDHLDADLLDQDAISSTQEGNLEADIMRSRSLNAKNNLKPLPYPPQESFELEEISSAENAFEDWNGNISKTARRGLMEKSASTHSDSSGFADLDTVWETTQSSQDFSKENLLMQTRGTDITNKTDFKPSVATSHDQNLTHNAPQLLSEGQQKRNTTSLLEEISETYEKGNAHVTYMNQPRHFFVCKKDVDIDSDKENKPTLSSISYAADGQIQDRSLVYTLSVPIETVKAKDAKPSRYISSVSLNVEGKSIDSEDHSSIKSSKVVQVGQTKFLSVNEKFDLDIAPSDNTNYFEGHRKNVQRNDNLDLNDNSVDLNQNYSKGQHSTGIVSPYRMKEEVLEKRRAKEALIAAKSHTADWLLNSHKHLQTGTRNSSDAPFRMGRPVWASTPNLKIKKNASHYENDSRRIKKEGNHSFDLLLQEDQGTNNEQSYTGTQFVPGHSVDELDSRPPLAAFDGKLHLSDLRGDSACSSMDESIDISRPSLVGNSYSMPEDHLNYLRLARLVNGPSLITDVAKMPNSKFMPSHHMKNWTQLPKRKHLEEETMLMQHAVQRYKTELCLMENMLFALYRTAQEELEPEDRADVEELQHLWCEVRKEVIKMEELLAQRLKAIMAGNDTYNPLDALEIVQSMIELLREQLYQQQMCIGRDISFTEEDIEEFESSRCPSAVSASSSISEAWMSDISSQMSDIRSSLASAEQKQKQELHERISELKKSLLSEVKGELSTTQNAKMLQLQLQARDNEIRRLKMELLLQNVTSGGTRKKHMLESDV